MQEASDGNQAVESRRNGLVEVAFTIDEASGTVARARRLVAQHFVRHGLTDAADDAELVAGELITNALLHAGPPAELVLRLSPSRARLEVRDNSPVPPVRPRPSTDGMTGRGLFFVETLAHAWGVTALDTGKVVWAEFALGSSTDAAEEVASDYSSLWRTHEQEPAAPAEKLYTVRLGDVPTDLLLSAKTHVDNLVREFTLAASGARSGATGAVPEPVAELIDAVVNGFAEARQAIKRQALIAAEAGEERVRLEVTLPVSAADAGVDYLRALDQTDAYCRAQRLLTLESPPQHRVFRRWYVEELIRQLRRAADGDTELPAQTFERRLLSEIDVLATAERRAERSVRLHSLIMALAAAATPEDVAGAVLREGVSALGASGGGVLLAADSPILTVPGTLGYDEAVVARLRSEPRDAELPAAVALRTGEPIWLESRAERDERFPELAGMESATVSMCAVPLIIEKRVLGALRFSFTEARLFDATERDFVEAMAAQTAQALERAQLSRERADASRRLQRGLLPPGLPEIPGIDVWAAYQPLTETMDVGGDFYDVWSCGPHRWAIAIGDVCGTGPEAAATTALIRHTLRALTMTSDDLDTILRQLDVALAEMAVETPNERFSTVLLGVLTATPGAFWLDLASGGHPGPIIVHPDGSVDEVELTGSVLGVLPNAAMDRRRIALEPGDEVVMVTDGASDARNSHDFFGMEGVVAVAKAAYARNANTAEAIEHAVFDYGGGRMQDDLAVLVLHRRLG
jgi:serine phosphatase RsbU (regulator of sigma subunit)